MPPVRKITKEDIIKKSLFLVNEEGLTSLNARRLAKELMCSTQPIFSQFKNMEELNSAVVDEIYHIFDKYMLKENYNHLVYKDIGLNYIHFAKEYPNYFKILFQIDKKLKARSFVELTGPSKRIFETIQKQTGLSNEDVVKFHIKMWFYVNGIANLVSNNTCEFTDIDLDNFLKEQYLSMLLYEYKKGNIKKEVIDNVINNKLTLTKGGVNNEGIKD